MAAEGRYLSPVAFDPCVEGLPLLVLHSCFVHAFRLLCGFFKLDISLPLPNLSKVLGRLQDPVEHVPVLLMIVNRKPNPDSHRLPFCTVEPASGLYERSTVLVRRPYRQT